MNLQLRLILAAALLVAGLAGCIQFKGRVTVNADRSADIDVRILVNEALRRMAQDDPLETMRERAERQGYVITNVKENDYAGVHLKRHVATLDELINDEVLRGEGKGENRFSFKSESSFFGETYKLDMNFDLETVPAALVSQGGLMEFGFSFPPGFKVESHNAARVEDDGRTFVWNLVPGSKFNRLQLTGQTTFLGRAVALALGAVLVLLLIGGLALATILWRTSSAAPRA